MYEVMSSGINSVWHWGCVQFKWRIYVKHRGKRVKNGLSYQPFMNHQTHLKFLAVVRGHTNFRLELLFNSEVFEFLQIQKQSICSPYIHMLHVFSFIKTWTLFVQRSRFHSLFFHLVSITTNTSSWNEYFGNRLFLKPYIH